MRLAWATLAVGAVLIAAALVAGHQIRKDPPPPDPHQRITAGRIEIINARGEVVVRLCANEDGNGHIACFDRFGRGTESLPLPQEPRAFGGRRIKKIIDPDEFIMLDDDSVWEVSDQHYYSLYFWEPGAPVLLVDRKNAEFPQVMINVDTGESTSVRLVPR